MKKDEQPSYIKFNEQRKRYTVNMRVHGKSVFRSFSRLRDAEQFRDEQLRLREEAIEVVSIGYRGVVEIINEYLASASFAAYSQNTRTIRQRLYNRLLSDVLDEDDKVQDMDFEFYKDFYKAVAKFDIKITTAQDYRKCFKEIINYLRKEHSYDARMDLHDVAWKDVSELKLFNKAERREVNFDDKDYIKLKKYQPRHRINNPSVAKYAFMLALETGMRRNEMYLMRWKDVKSKIVKGKTVYYYDLAKEKMDYKNNTHSKGRNIPLNFRALAILRLLKYIYKEYGNESDWVFTYSSVDSFGGSVGRMLKRVINKSSIWLHGGRHKFATDAIESGLASGAVMSLTGHKDVKSLAVYDHSNPLVVAEYAPSNRGK